MINLRKLDVRAGNSDAGAHVQTTGDFGCKYLRGKVAPWIERDDLSWICPGKIGWYVDGRLCQRVIRFVCVGKRA